jgi:hypothetical protein
LVKKDVFLFIFTFFIKKECFMNKVLFIKLGIISLFCLISPHNISALFSDAYDSYETVEGDSSEKENLPHDESLKSADSPASRSDSHLGSTDLAASSSSEVASQV